MSTVSKPVPVPDRPMESPTITIQRSIVMAHYGLCYPATGGNRPCGSSRSLSIGNTGGGNPQLDGHQRRDLAEDLAELRDRADHHEGLGRRHWRAPWFLFWLYQCLGDGSDEQPTDGYGALHQAIAWAGSGPSEVVSTVVETSGSTTVTIRCIRPCDSCVADNRGLVMSATCSGFR
jgi:hypothetical protein